MNTCCGNTYRELGTMAYCQCMFNKLTISFKLLYLDTAGENFDHFLELLLRHSLDSFLLGTYDENI